VGKKLTAKQIAIIATIVAVIVGGGVTPLTKIALYSIPVFGYTFLRFLFATIILLPFFLKNKPEFHKNFYKLILFSLFLSANVIVFPFGVRLTTATIAQTLYVFVPIFTAIISYFLLAEVFSFKKIIGILVGLSGALVIILLPEIMKGSPFAGNLVGNLIIFAGVITVAIYTVLSKKFQKHYTPFQINAVFIFTTCVLSFFFMVLELFFSPTWWQHVAVNSLLGTIYVGILGTAIWYLLYQYVIKHTSPLVASMILYLQPVATFIWASLLLGEQITTGFLIGTALAFIGVYLTLQSPNKKR
jgi:drug/metabolite transporter (DMT)-like permease